MKNKKEFCTRTPQFPKKAYVLALWFAGSDDTSLPYYYMPIFHDMASVLAQAKNATGELKKEGINVLKEILIVPIKFESLYPLKRDFWLKPSIKYDEWTRWELMLKATRFYKLHKLIVTSSFAGKEGEILTAAFPYKYNCEDYIEAFMKASDYPVSRSAKYAAVYSIEEPIGYDTLTNQIIRSEDEKNVLAKN